MGNIEKMEKLDKKIIVLNNEKYLVYLKRVAIEVFPGGEAKSTAIRAFVRKLGRAKKHTKTK